MWIRFFGQIRDKTHNRYVIRPFVGGVNAISGKPAVGDMSSILRSLNPAKGRPQQDYVVLPDQLWLDGVATAPGVVKQFVATPMLSPRQQQMRTATRQVIKESRTRETFSKKNSNFELGASVELQITGYDKTGGIQLLVVPQHDWKRMSFSRHENHIYTGKECTRPAGPECEPLDPKSTPRSLGLVEGDALYLKDLKNRAPDRLKVLRDLESEAPNFAKVDGNIVLKAYTPYIKEVLVRVSCPERPNRAHFEVEVGCPYLPT
jgi:hypothetical protein